jgi:hypothetical protein
MDRLSELESRIAQLETRRVYQQDIIPAAVKQRHIDGLIIFRGLVANRPVDGSTEIQVYFSTDEDKLYVWNDVSEAWKSVTLA